MSKTLEVILLDDIRGLGKFGQQKKVKAGYARNFLLPNNQILLVNKDNLKRFESIRKKEERVRAERKADAESIIKVLDQQTITFERQVAESGKLYGSVSVHDVITKIKDDYKITLEKKVMRMPDHYKEPGEFEFGLELIGDVNGKMKLVIKPVEPEDEKEKPKGK